MPAGRPGPQGLSDAFTTAVAAKNFTGTLGGPQQVASMTLPAGNYVVFAKAPLVNQSSGTETLSCSIATAHTSAADSMSITLKPDGEEPMVLMGSATVGPASVRTQNFVMDCSPAGLPPTSGILTFGPGQMTAIRIGALHAQ